MSRRSALARVAAHDLGHWFQPCGRWILKEVLEQLVRTLAPPSRTNVPTTRSSYGV